MFFDTLEKLAAHLARKLWETPRGFRRDAAVRKQGNGYELLFLSEPLPEEGLSTYEAPPGAVSFPLYPCSERENCTQCSGMANRRAAFLWCTTKSLMDELPTRLEERDDPGWEDFVGKMMAFMRAEEEAFRKAGIKVGRVEFTCPICGGKAIGNRYYHGGRIHGLGSGCTKCGIRHS